MEDALKKLDKLTQEEARMAMAENLKATHTVDERVRGVATSVAVIDNRVADVGDRVAGVDDRVAGVDDRVARVDDSVDRVARATRDLDDGVRGVREQVLVVEDRIKQAADDADQVKRSSFNFIFTMSPYTSFQENCRGRTFTNGFPHRIHQLTITLRVIPITRRQQPGSFKEAFSGDGNQQVRSFGFTGKVRYLLLLAGYPLMRS